MSNYNIDVETSEEQEELLEKLLERARIFRSEVNIRLDVFNSCYYLAPEEDYGYYLSPCLASLEDLFEWVRDNPKELREQYNGFLLECVIETVPSRQMRGVYEN